MRHISDVIKEKPKGRRGLQKGQKIDKKPSPRHLVVFREISENLGKGKGSVGAAIKKAKYSESYSKSPQQLTNTKSWKALMKIHLSQESLAKHHEELLNAKEVSKFDFPIAFTDEEILKIIEGYGYKLVQIITNNTGMPEFRSRKAYYITPNTRAKKDALDMAYKLDGLYEPEKHSHKFDGLTKEELIEFIIGGAKGEGGSDGGTPRKRQKRSS